MFVSCNTKISSNNNNNNNKEMEEEEEGEKVSTTQINTLKCALLHLSEWKKNKNNHADEDE